MPSDTNSEKVEVGANGFSTETRDLDIATLSDFYVHRLLQAGIPFDAIQIIEECLKDAYDMGASMQRNLSGRTARSGGKAEELSVRSHAHDLARSWLERWGHLEGLDVLPARAWCVEGNPKLNDKMLREGILTGIQTYASTMTSPRGRQLREVEARTVHDWLKNSTLAIRFRKKRGSI